MKYQEEEEESLTIEIIRSWLNVKRENIVKGFSRLCSTLTNYLFLFNNKNDNNLTIKNKNKTTSSDVNEVLLLMSLTTSTRVTHQQQQQQSSFDFFFITSLVCKIIFYIFSKCVYVMLQGTN